LVTDKTKKIVLGTAQFGMDYGITNLQGKISMDLAHQILDDAVGMNINTLDTAISYGDSQSLLGQYSNLTKFSIITKVPELDMPIKSSSIINAIKSSLNILNKAHLEYCLLHRPEQLLQEGGGKIWKTLEQLKQDGLIGKIGCSVYEPEMIEMLIENFDLDVVQAPYSIFDRRLDSSGLLAKLNHLNIEVHVRSIFLQGLLLMPSHDLPSKFFSWRDAWINFEKWLEDGNINRMNALVNFALQDQRIDKVLVGVSSQNDLKQIAAALVNQNLFNAVPNFSNDPNLLDPRKW
jgi:aryl-alcohol dehydrogenase-like predicted oxidoreductase